MEFETSILEDWMRKYYFTAAVDIGSSGVRDLSIAELRGVVGLDLAEIDQVVLRDSPSLGARRLRAAIAAWKGVDADWVMTTHGASEAIYLALMSLLSAGDEVVVLDPGYHSYTSIARSKHCVVRKWCLRAESDFAADLDALEAIVTQRTRLIVVNFPHNPTGVTISMPEQRRLVEIAASVDAYLVWDDAFGEIVYNDPVLLDPTSYYSKAVSVGTLSKYAGLPGLRFGWCIAQPDALQMMFGLRDRMTLHLSPLIELIAAKVVENIDAVTALPLKQAVQNLEIVTDWMRERPRLVESAAPGGGVTMFPRLAGYDDTYGLCAHLAEERKVLLVPGQAFGHPDRVRLGFGGSSDSLAAGLGVLGEILESRSIKQQEE